MPEIKSFWKSRTLWVNAIAIALLAIEQSVGLVKASGLITEDKLFAAFSLALAVVNAVLRVTTSSGIALTTPPPSPALHLDIERSGTTAANATSQPGAAWSATHQARDVADGEF